MSTLTADSDKWRFALGTPSKSLARLEERGRFVHHGLAQIVARPVQGEPEPMLVITITTDARDARRHYRKCPRLRGLCQEPLKTVAHRLGDRCHDAIVVRDLCADAGEWPRSAESTGTLQGEGDELLPAVHPIAD
ncbi:MAG TPA: hypothetical protein VIH11_04840 [Gemmatimonadaceae bacterium]|nr:MAG: hypothetical protein A2W08_11775 [Candidatus Rokubacteria bacterium RBG_16_73_20]HBH03593.1 hypothetical protein [Candidatus Rokubacteria bacterium]